MPCLAGENLSVVSGQVGGGDGQVEIPIVGDTVGVREGQLGGGGWLELVIHGPTVTEFIKYLSNVPPPPHLQEVLR